VLPGIARSARVCAYDRPGTLRYSENQGSITTRTSPVPMPRTAADVVTDLHTLLRAADVPGPYVLVAHSLGGIFSRLYPTAERIDLDTSINQLDQAPPMRPVPLPVISKTEPFGGLPPTLPGSLTGADIERLWPQVQAGVVAIQPQTPQTLAAGSDHYIQVRQPDLVISATRLLVARVGG
jgi:pimeloyl-ACP methyl ester carboxylesterase